MEYCPKISIYVFLREVVEVGVLSHVCEFSKYICSHELVGADSVVETRQ